MGDRDIVTWPVGSTVRIGVAGQEATVVEVIPTYRVEFPSGAWMVVEAAQIKDGTRP